MARVHELVVGTVGNVYDLNQTRGEKKTSVLNFSVACTERVRNGDTWEDGETTWVNCTAWGRLAENIKETWRPGDHVMIWGRRNTSTYKKDGEKISREVLTAEFAGHEESFFRAEAPRDQVKKGGNSSNNSSSSSRSSAPSEPKKESAPRPVEKKEEKKEESDPFDFDFSFE